MKILALETATEACSVAVFIDGAVYEHFELVQQRHSERILPMINTALVEAGLVLADLDALALGRGPGSFTALRIGAGVIQGLAFGAALPVIPISSLAALAQLEAGSRVFAALDARMDQVYYGAYVRDERGQMQLQGAEGVAHPEAITVSDEGWEGAGSGWDRYAPRLTAALGKGIRGWRPHAYPRARGVALLAATTFAAGQAVSAENALPMYVRDEVAHKPKRD